MVALVAIFLIRKSVYCIATLCRQNTFGLVWHDSDVFRSKAQPSSASIVGVMITCLTFTFEVELTKCLELLGQQLIKINYLIDFKT